MKINKTIQLIIIGFTLLMLPQLVLKTIHFLNDNYLSFKIDPTVYTILIFPSCIIWLFLIFRGISIVRKAVFGKIITELPFLTKEQEFEISENGEFSIWYKGRLFQKLPLTEFKPKITLGDYELSINKILLKTKINGFSTGRIAFFNFKTTKGKHKIQVIKESSLNTFETIAYSISSSLIRYNSIDDNNITLQIRKNQPILISFLGILSIVFGCLLLIFSIITGIKAKEIFP
jgi:hypothetical protein